MKLPQLDELVALRGAAHGLALQTHRPARAVRTGAHRSAQRGRGLEFEEVRPYIMGDDPRSIDWRVTARRGRPHTRLYREERERPIWLIVDLHAGLFFGSRRQLKSTVAVRAAALLAWAGVQGGDRVGALVLGNGAPLILPPRARDAGVLPILNALITAQPTAPGRRSEPLIDEPLQELAALVHPGSLLLLLSDFAREGDNTHIAWSRLLAHSEGWLFWLTDPLEKNGLPPGRFRAGWPDRLSTFDGERSRQAWREAWRSREERVRALASRFMLPLMELSTTDPVEERLAAILSETR
jgi:uncharacterized protein (DUF58 family)